MSHRNMKVFMCREIDEAYEHAKAGGQALHLHEIIVDRKRAPRCFVQAVDAGQPIAHLFDQDEARLVQTAKRLGVRVVVVEHRGRLNQHVDLCGKPLAKAMEVVMGSWAEAYEACGRVVAGVALDRATYTGRPFAVACGSNGFGWTVRPAALGTEPGWTRVIVVQPDEDEMGVMKRLATARQAGIAIPPAVKQWATQTRPENNPQIAPGCLQASEGRSPGANAEPAAPAAPEPGFLF